MGDLSKHFNRSEFACHCGCGFDRIDPELVIRLEAARSYFGLPITIHSGCRCPKHNAAVKGVKNSQHVQGIAADVVIKGISPNMVAQYFSDRFPDAGGLGRYDTFTHVDVRPVKARWDERTKK